MKTFILGVILTLVALAAAAYVAAHFGFIDMRADQKLSNFETTFAGGAMDASVGRHAPALTNPIEPTDANLLAGMTIYQEKCAQCHGDPQMPESTLAEYPPAPQFLSEPADMPENQNFYIIQHGIRLTAMPGWKESLNDDQIWKLVTFLSHMEKLPPAVEQQWKK